MRYAEEKDNDKLKSRNDKKEETLHFVQSDKGEKLRTKISMKDEGRS